MVRDPRTSARTSRQCLPSTVASFPSTNTCCSAPRGRDRSSTPACGSRRDRGHVGMSAAHSTRRYGGNRSTWASAARLGAGGRKRTGVCGMSDRQHPDSTGRAARRQTDGRQRRRFDASMHPHPVFESGHHVRERWRRGCLNDDNTVLGAKKLREQLRAAPVARMGSPGTAQPAALGQMVAKGAPGAFG